MQPNKVKRPSSVIRSTSVANLYRFAETAVRDSHNFVASRRRLELLSIQTMLDTGQSLWMLQVGLDTQTRFPRL